MYLRRDFVVDLASVRRTLVGEKGKLMRLFVGHVITPHVFILLNRHHRKFQGERNGATIKDEWLTAINTYDSNKVDDL